MASRRTTTMSTSEATVVGPWIISNHIGVLYRRSWKTACPSTLRPATVLLTYSVGTETASLGLEGEHTSHQAIDRDQHERGKSVNKSTSVLAINGNLQPRRGTCSQLLTLHSQ